MRSSAMWAGSWNWCRQGAPQDESGKKNVSTLGQPVVRSAPRDRLSSSNPSPIRRSASAPEVRPATSAHTKVAQNGLVWATATSMAEALRLIGEGMELERRSLGAEWTTGCLGVVNQCIYRSRRPWGVEPGRLQVESDVEPFFPHSHNEGRPGETSSRIRPTCCLAGRTSYCLEGCPLAFLIVHGC